VDTIVNNKKLGIGQVMRGMDVEKIDGENNEGIERSGIAHIGMLDKQIENDTYGAIKRRAEDRSGGGDFNTKDVSHFRTLYNENHLC